jgi:methylated-DNA-protein-cysteine methyltransferase-like protein
MPRSPLGAPSRFALDVAEVIRSIPSGQTLSYGGVAGLAGRPGAPRAVLRVLRTTLNLPWWRVVRSDGTLAEEVATDQARRLRAEGVEINGRRIVRGETNRSRAPRKR